MQRKRQITLVLIGLIALLIILMVIEVRKTTEFLGMPMLTAKDAVTLEQEFQSLDISIDDTILFNNASIAYDTDKKTIYISQNSGSTWYGILSTVSEDAKLYWLEDKAFADKKEAIRTGHIFTFYYVTKEGYVKGNLISTGLPVISFQKIYSDKSEYQGEIRVIHPNDAEGNTYSSKTSYARVEEKVKSTNLYEREYRIHLLESDKKTKRNMELLGMDKNDDWELHSFYTDDSLVREKLAADLWNEIIKEDASQSTYGMGMEYAEVVINGQYMGVYGLTEHADHKSLNLQEEDKVFKDIASEPMMNKAIENYDNYVDYSLFMQCIDGVQNINEKKTVIIKKLEEKKEQKSYEVFRMPDKLRNIMSDSTMQILEDMELQRMVRGKKQQDTLVRSMQERYQEIRQTIFTEEALQEYIETQKEYLLQTGAVIREQELRKSKNVTVGINELQDFLTNRLMYLDTYYKLADAKNKSDENKSDHSKTLVNSTTLVTDAIKNKEEFRAETLNSGIPTVYLTINGGEESIEALHSSKENEAYGTIFIDVPENYTSEYTIVSQGDYSGNLEYIRCRGQSSFAADKKSYKVEFADKIDLFGMGESKDWILLANCYDESLLRNKIAYWFADDIGMAFAPKSVYVNVVMNGEKLGCYMLGEQVKVADNRVELSVPDEKTDPMQYSYMVEILPEGRAVREEGYMVAPYSGEYFIVRYPKGLSPNSEYYYNIAMDLLQFDQMLYAGDTYNLQELEQYVDIDSVIDYYWVQEIFKNTDVMYASTFFYQDVDGRLSFGPVWDFDLSIGMYRGENAHTVENWYARNMDYYERLFRNPEFVERVVKRYQEIRPEMERLITDTDKRKSIMHMYQTQLGENRQKNLTMWGVSYGWNSKEKVFDKQTTLEEMDTFITSWLTQHIAWMDNNLDTLLIKEEAGNENINGE